MLRIYECVCSQGVRFRTRQLGEYCAGCGEIKVFFDREVADGKRASATRLLDLVAGRCGWHEDGLSELAQSQQREQAEQTCHRRKPGSRAVATTGNRHRPANVLVFAELQRRRLLAIGDAIM